jgi:hypothetical protein
MKKIGSLLSMLILTVGLLLTVVSVTATCGDCQNVCDGDGDCDGTQKHLIVVANDGTTDIDIRIAPATLNLNDEVWASDEPYVTVHAEIPFSTVDTTSLTLETDGNTVNAISTNADNRGNLVVKFDRREVAGIVMVGEEVKLTLTGKTTGDVPFTGSATIRVIDQPVK